MVLLVILAVVTVNQIPQSQIKPFVDVILSQVC